MKRISTLIFAFIILATQQLFAVPVYHNPINHTLPDGSQITIQMRGGKSLNWAETLDGFTLLLNSDGFFEYATLNNIGDLVPSGIRVNDAPRRTRAEQDFLRNIPRGLRFSDAQIETKRELRGVRDEFLRRRTQESPRRISGDVRIPVILVGFADRPFTKTRDDFYMLFNQLNTGSVHDYFYDVSHGRLNLQAEIFGPFILPNPIAFYDDECAEGSPIGPRIMARQAVDSAYHSGADFSTFHYTIVDGVPTLSTVHIIFAGHCQSINPNALRCQAIWSHAWVLDVARTFNGIRIWDYSCSAELRGASGQNMETIGTIVHELGHSLFGWPDSYSVWIGPGTGNCVDFGTWCLMANGVRNGIPTGSVPARPSAWFLVDAGWTDEITLTEPQDVTIPNPMQTGRIYRINTTTPGEYFLLENRQQIGWDAFIPASGLLISHVDRTPEALPFWDGNEILSHCNRRRLFIKQAGCGLPNGCLETRANDVWGRVGFTEFTDNSTPNAQSWAGENTNKPVTHITHNVSDRTISFRFMYEPPIVEPATVPYFEGFEYSGTVVGGPLPEGWTLYSQIQNVPLNVWFPMAGIGVDGTEFRPHTGYRQMVRLWPDAGDFVWAFSEPIQLYADTTYIVSFWYLAPGHDGYYDNFKVQIAPSRELEGTGTSAEMTDATTLLELYNESVPNWTQVSVEFTPTVSGPHYFGFHCMTEFGEGMIIAIDDISIVRANEKDTTSTNIRDVETHNCASLRVFPNPVTDNLHITTDELRIGDIVEIFDMNGRRVFAQRVETLHATSLHDDGTIVIDISHLPNGTYIVRIGNRSTIIIKQ